MALVASQKFIPYDVAISRKTTHGTIINSIKDNSVVLDLGCSGGYIGKYLIENNGCEFYGIDIDELHTKQVLDLYKDIIIADLDNINILESFDIKFDYIILSDVLEHLKYPARLLRDISQLLNTNGRVVFSIPNVAYWKIRLMLLFGIFDEGVSDILSREHLQFYTYKESVNLINSSGYEIISFTGAGNKMPRFLRMILPKFFSAQFVFMLKPRDNNADA